MAYRAFQNELQLGLQHHPKNAQESLQGAYRPLELRSPDHQQAWKHQTCQESCHARAG